jgi:hypothetical protein
MPRRLLWRRGRRSCYPAAPIRLLARYRDQYTDIRDLRWLNCTAAAGEFDSSTSEAAV